MGVHGSFFLSIRHYAHGVTPLANYWRSLQFSIQKTPVFGEPCQEVTFYKKNKQQSHAKSISTFGYHPGSHNEADFPDCYVAPCCITSSKDFLNIFKHSISIYIWVPRKFCRVATFGTCTSFLVLIAVHCRSLFCSVFCALVITLWLQVSLRSPLNGSYRLQNATRCYKYSFKFCYVSVQERQRHDFPYRNTMSQIAKALKLLHHRHLNLALHRDMNDLVDELNLWHLVTPSLRGSEPCSTASKHRSIETYIFLWKCAHTTVSEWTGCIMFRFKAPLAGTNPSNP